MPLIHILQLLSLGVILCSDKCRSEVPPCRQNWFGSPCRYECHCVDDRCNKTTGECTESTTCTRGWFGPSCQYVDLVSANTATLTPAWIYDFPDILCNPGQDTVLVSLSDTFYFTWLRLRANISVHSQDFNLQLISNKGYVECNNMHTSKISDTILDIHCLPGAFFQQLIITGTGVKSLCSVYISGGRNVALGQATTQTTVFLSSTSVRAVDGDTNPVFEFGTCTHTDVDDKTPAWTLTFDWLHQVNRYVLYNRDDHQKRLWGFILEADQENRSVAFTYADNTNTTQSIYRIQSTTPQIPVSRVTIFATFDEPGVGKVLTLCEVEMFGETLCPAGQYGRECENKCNCAKDGENCFVSTGGCPSGCSPGYQGERCQTPCSKTYFGVDCSQKCSTDCKNQDCQPSTGSCLSCPPGKQGALCDRVCDAKLWGDNCSKLCSAACKDQLCNAVNGACVSCVAGKSGENCDEDCSASFYGENCALSCSSNCADQLCSATDGICQSCVIGMSGLYCEKALSSNEPDESPPVGAIVGPVVAVVVLIALIVGGVFIWRRHQRTRNRNGQTSQVRFQNAGVSECLGSEKICAETPKQLKAVTGQANLTVMRKPINNQDNADLNQHHVDGGYYNLVPRLGETPDVFRDKETSTAENRTEDQQQVNIVVASNSGDSAAADSSDHQYDRHTNSNDDNPYEIQITSTKVTQKSRQLKSEDGLACTKELTANIYENIDDTIPNPYQDIDDIQPM